MEMMCHRQVDLHWRLPHCAWLGGNEEDAFWCTPGASTAARGMVLIVLIASARRRGAAR